MKPDYPIPVESIDGKRASALACPECAYERQATSDEIGFIEPEFHTACPHCGEGLVFKYALADKCPGCGRLGWWDTPASYNGACSRACHLQAEYAAQIKPAPTSLPSREEENVNDG